MNKLCFILLQETTAIGVRQIKGFHTEMINVFCFTS